MVKSVSEREIAWHNSPPGQLLNRIEHLIFRTKLRYSRRANGVPFAKASAELTEQAAAILRKWQLHLLAHGKEIHELRLAGVGERRINSLYPDAMVIANVGADFAELADHPKVRRILRRASWRRLSKGSGVVPAWSPAFHPRDVRDYFDLRYDSPRKPEGELLLPFIFLSLAKPGAYPAGQQHEFNSGLHHMRYLLRVAESLTPHLSSDR